MRAVTEKPSQAASVVRRLPLPLQPTGYGAAVFDDGRRREQIIVLDNPGQFGITPFKDQIGRAPAPQRYGFPGMAENQFEAAGIKLETGEGKSCRQGRLDIINGKAGAGLGIVVFKRCQYPGDDRQVAATVIKKLNQRGAVTVVAVNQKALAADVRALPGKGLDFGVGGK